MHSPKAVMLTQWIWVPWMSCPGKIGLRAGMTGVYLHEKLAGVTGMIHYEWAKLLEEDSALFPSVNKDPWAEWALFPGRILFTYSTHHDWWHEVLYRKLNNTKILINDKILSLAGIIDYRRGWYGVCANKTVYYHLDTVH